jgi:PAS domain S-box-containing protein
MKALYFNHKFTIWFIAFCLVMLIVGAINMNSLRRSNETTRAMFGTVISDLALIGDLQFQMQEVRRQALYSLTTTDAKLQVQYAEESRASDSLALKLINNLANSNIQSIKNTGLTQKLTRDWNTYLVTRNETISLILEGRNAEAMAFDLKNGLPQFNRIRADLLHLKEQYKADSEKQINEDVASSRSTFTQTMVLRILTLLLTGWAMYAIQRKMLKTVEKKAEQAEEAQAFSEAIISNAGEGIVVYDRDLNFLVWNQAMERFTGISSDQIIGKPALKIFPWMNSEGVDYQLELALNGETVTSSDVPTELSNGSRRWHSALYSPQRNSKGEIIGVIGMISDITQRKQDEEELRSATIRLEQSNRELQDFAFVASHDLQEPLRKIQAFGDRLKTKYGTTLDETALDYLQRMQGAAARMQTLINDLLTFSRVTSKSKPFESVDLEEITRAVLSDLEIRIEQTGATVDVAPLPVIDADPTQMRQLIQNLLSNALKFQKSDVKPHIKIAADRVNSAADFCEITVTDNGIGFEEKYADRIFTLFQRLHGRSEYEGTGVGLAVCRRIVERHGGQIKAESVPQAGAKFIISIPARQQVTG